jgi:hypothetical protein
MGVVESWEGGGEWEGGEWEEEEWESISEGGRKIKGRLKMEGVCPYRKRPRISRTLHHSWSHPQRMPPWGGPQYRDPAPA